MKLKYDSETFPIASCSTTDTPPRGLSIMTLITYCKAVIFFLIGTLKFKNKCENDSLQIFYGKTGDNSKNEQFFFC